MVFIKFKRNLEHKNLVACIWALTLRHKNPHKTCTFAQTFSPQESH